MKQGAFLTLAIAVVVVSCTEPETAVTSSVVSSTTSTTVGATSSTFATEAPTANPYGGTTVMIGWGDTDEFATISRSVEELATGGFNTGWHIRRWNIDRWVPGLLEEVPTVENGLITFHEDGSMTIRYEIHAVAAWEDGVQVTGDDFAFTYDFMMTHFDELAGIAEGLSNFPSWIDELPTLDPTLFIVEEGAFEFTMPVASHRWADLFGVVVPKHQVEGTTPAEWIETGANWYAAEPWLEGYGGGPVATGPSGLPEQRRERNDRYWVTDDLTGQRLPFWDAQRWIFLPDPGEAWDYFVSNPEADYVFGFVGPDTEEDIVAQDLVFVPFGGVFEHLAFNFRDSRLDTNPNSLTDHLEFRQAIAHALDRQRVAQEVYIGRIDAIESYVSVFSPSHSTDAWATYDYDPDKARDLLVQLCAELERDCVAEPPTLNFDTTAFGPWRPATAALVEEMLGDVGISVTVNAEHGGPGEFLDSYEVSQFAWNTGQPGLEALVGIHEVFVPGPDSVYGWGDPGSESETVVSQRFTEITQEMLSTFDSAALAALISEAEQILADELVFIPLFPQGAGDFWKPGRVFEPEAELIATAYPGAWERFYRLDLGGRARNEP